MAAGSPRKQPAEAREPVTAEAQKPSPALTPEVAALQATEVSHWWDRSGEPVTGTVVV